jgi:hypothetical protein
MYSYKLILIIPAEITGLISYDEVIDSHIQGSPLCRNMINIRMGKNKYHSTITLKT